MGEYIMECKNYNILPDKRSLLKTNSDLTVKIQMVSRPFRILTNFPNNARTKEGESQLQLVKYLEKSQIKSLEQ